MVTHLYKNFLQSKEVYKDNIEYWKTVVYTLLSNENKTFHSYLTTTKMDGSLYMDGNPIYNFRLDNSNRAVRIIQEEIEENTVEFSAWLNSLELENETIYELVISLELSHESVLLATELINAWIINNYPKEKMEAFIDKLFNLKDAIFFADTEHSEQINA